MKPSYTPADMMRDLAVPVCIVVAFISIWTGFSAIQAAMMGTSVWACVIHPTCGVMP